MPSTKPDAPPPTPESVGAVPSPNVATYLREELKFPSNDPYVGVNFTANAAWKLDQAEGAAVTAAKRMQADPKLRLFVTFGVFDFGGGNDGTGFLQAGVPADRLTVVQFPGPHQVYDGDGNRARFSDELRKFVAGPTFRGRASQLFCSGLASENVGE
jgi:hypothetical protein